MSWLKAIDENAGARDRQLESKPSTYCHMEVVDEADALDDVEASPALPSAVPTVPIAKIPALSLLSHPAATVDGFLREPIALPAGAAASFAGSSSEAALKSGVTSARAAAAAACLVGAAPPPPLAWLLAQSGLSPTAAAAAAAYAAQAQAAHAHLQPPPTTAHVLPRGVPAGLPVAVASHKAAPKECPPVATECSYEPMVCAPMPHWTVEAAMGAALSGPGATLPPLCPLPGAGNGGAWSPDFLGLFSPTASPGDAEISNAAQQLAVAGEEAASGSTAEADPLCLSPPMPTGVTSATCVSPFELEKRPKPFVPSAQPAASPSGASPCGLAPIAAPTEDLGDLLNLTDDSLPMMKDAEYSAFIEALLAV